MGMYDVTKQSFDKVTPEMNKEAAEAIRYVWGQIASDACECFDRDYCTRAEMLELVLDADRLSSHYAYNTTVEEALRIAQYVIWMKWHKPTAWKAFLKEFFPYKSY